MELLIARCAGLDVHQATVVATVRTPDEHGGRRRVTETFGTMTPDLLALREWLQAYGVTHVALESTGVYWKPVYYVLEDAFTLLLINMHDLKRVAGRKTDVRDSEWLAQLLECGLLKPSFVPPPPIRELRDLTRYRLQQVRDRSQEVNRLCKVLEDTGLKLTTVITDVMGVSGRAMLHALWRAPPTRWSWPTWRGADYARNCQTCGARCRAAFDRTTRFSSSRSWRRSTSSMRLWIGSRRKSIGAWAPSNQCWPLSTRFRGSIGSARSASWRKPEAT